MGAPYFDSWTCLWDSSDLPIQFRFGVPQRSLLGIFCSSMLWFTVVTCLSLPFWGQQFTLWPYFSGKSQKSYWFFSFFSFVLVRAEWQLPCPLHAGLETRTVCFYLWCSTQRTTEWYAQNKDIQGWILFLWNWILDLKRALEVNSFNLLFRCISRWYALLWTLLSQYSHILAE